MDPIAERNDPSQHEAGGPGGQGSSGLGEARAELADAVEPMKKKAQSFAEQQRVVGAERIGDVAHAVHGAAEELEGRLPRVAGYIHDAAARLEDASSSLRERNLDELLGAFNRFARNQPAAVFGGAMLVGFAFSRFLKSSGAAWREPGQR
jgi:hypothetical protein